MYSGYKTVETELALAQDEKYLQAIVDHTDFEQPHTAESV